MCREVAKLEGERARRANKRTGWHDGVRET